MTHPPTTCIALYLSMYGSKASVKWNIVCCLPQRLVVCKAEVGLTHFRDQGFIFHLMEVLNYLET